MGQLDLFLAVLLSASFWYAVAHAQQVRLSNGDDKYEGRVEVFYDGVWGTVCDDFWDDKACTVVCRQLGLSGGASRKNAAEKWGQGVDPIWLDDLKCDGSEKSLGECQMHSGGWGSNNCEHYEDAGCYCQSPGVTPVGSCVQERYHIRPFHPSYPYIGRVEVKNTLGQWELVCDDFWDDVDAAVFCNCFDIPSKDPRYFRAYWSSNLINMSPSLPVGYDGVHCTPEDMQSGSNIWECPNSPHSGTCQGATEAAAVACTPVPQAKPYRAPSSEISCNSQVLSVCFSSVEYTIQTHFLSLQPSCSKATARQHLGGVCYDINMHDCVASKIETDASYKHYCYDITYSEHSNDVTTLILNDMWTRRACCLLAKNGTVSSNFEPFTPTYGNLITNTSVKFSLDCYDDDDFNGAAMTFPANVTRGEDVFCKVSVQTWDPRLYLVVPECHFLVNKDGTPSYTFMQDRCPVTQDLGLAFFNIDSHNWGFKFKMPKFQGHDSLYLRCDGYLCDSLLDDKPYCDRSCMTPSSGQTKRDLQSAHRKSQMDMRTNRSLTVWDAFRLLLAGQKTEMFTGQFNVQTPPEHGGKPSGQKLIRKNGKYPKNTHTLETMKVAQSSIKRANQVPAKEVLLPMSERKASSAAPKLDFELVALVVTVITFMLFLLVDQLLGAWL